MKRALLFLAVAVLTPAQDILKQGEAVFNNTCATGYCHGARGAGGGAPRIAARGFDENFITGRVLRGVPGTAMPAFGTALAGRDVSAVVAYVGFLNGLTGSSRRIDGGPPPAPLSGDASRGRSLFSDAVRGFARCSTCHEIGGIGISVATPIARVPADAAAVKALATPQVSTATLGAESMPALVIGKKSSAIMFYDLTTPPPVLRTESPSAVQTRDGNPWRHSSVIGSYNDAELSAILAYLRVMVKP